MSELTNILAETAERLLADHATKDVLNQAEQGDWPEQLWQTLEENGLTQPLVPEDQGGIGATWADAFVIAFAAGRHRAPVPLVETMAAGWLLSQAKLEAPLGPLSLIDDGHQLQFSEAGFSGKARAVAWGEQAGHAVCALKADDGWQLGLLTSDDHKAAPDFNIAREPRDQLTVNGGTQAALATTSELSPVRLVGALMRSAQMAGAMGLAVEMAVTHAGDREQFGRPIAKFQAIQQMLAVAAAKTAEARMAAEIAFRAMDRALSGDDGDLSQAEFDIASAKIVCGEAVETVTDITHEVHGAIGFTYEHELHFTTRRLWSWRGEFGPETFWAERLGRAVLQRGAKNLWPDLTARQQ
jgi:acyl-CoA dehydrogenase